MALVSRRHRRLFASVALVSVGLALTDPAGAAPPPTDPPGPTVAPEAETPVPGQELQPSDEAVTLESVVTGSKSATSRLAQTDPTLLGRDDATPVQVMIKLDYDSVATYAGGVSGLAATSPSVTGRPLSGRSAAERAYEGFIEGEERAFADALASAAPNADVSGALRTVYGGVLATLPANQVEDVLAIDNVVAVQLDQLNQPLTDSSPDFIGATDLYGQMGVADSQAGEGVIFGVLDSGAWPEHPSFADQGNLDPPPAKADGTARTCDFGENPLTAEADPFSCNDKLIGGQAFLDTYLSNAERAAAEPYHTARDSNGHGTHTGSTAAGNVLEEAPVFGVDRGPINGVAPGAWVSVYKVCGIQGCYASDSAAAVAQAIFDGVDVINFSISGGTDPFTDPVELAFLDAYAAGVFVAASAGNSGPGAGTANHLSAWTTTVAASTQTREFQSTLTVTGGSGTYEVTGASITDGAGPAPIVLSSAEPYSNALCDEPASAGAFAGMIVACERGVIARVEKGYNVLQGGAVGMVLYNVPPTTDVETDNHWLPTVHLVDGTELVAFLNANPGATAEFTAGEAATGQGDVMASFSSRGPAGAFVKPDITAPGVQILAGHTPTPELEGVAGGPDGEYFQAIAGTSMSSPHIAGSALLLRAMHPKWTPMQVRSAMMLTATTDVVKEDFTTPADPFDFGAGRVDLSVAANPGLTMDESAENMAALAATAETGVHLNLPSINAPTMPGRLVTTRTFRNVTDRTVRYTAEGSAGPGSKITVEPRQLTVPPGRTAELTITIESTAEMGTQQFGEIRLRPRGNFTPLHLPVAFVPQQGDVALTSECDPSSISRRGGTSTCTVTATNNGFTEIPVDLRTTVNPVLTISGVEGATLTGGAAVASAALAGAQLGVPSVDPGTSPAGYLPLDLFGGTLALAIGDESIVNVDTPSFSYNGQVWSRVGVDSNGYLIVGGGTLEDNNCCNLPAGPHPAPPNNVLAPFWTDLDGTGAPGLLINVLTDGSDSWLIVEWRVNVWGTPDERRFQTWIGLTGDADPTQDISFTYSEAPEDPDGQDFLVGAENANGEGDMEAVLPTGDLRVTSSDPVPGDSFSYTVDVTGKRPGTGIVTTEMTGPDLPGGTTVVTSEVIVTP